MRMAAAGFTFALFIAALPAVAQVKFEVASVKHVDQCEFNSTLDPANFVLKGFPLRAIMREAFQTKPDQIEGPNWIDSDCYEIAARMPEGSALDQYHPMLLALLTERFKMTFHKVERGKTGFALMVDKDGPKCKPSDSDAPMMGRGRGGVVAMGRAGIGKFKGSMTMEGLANYLGGRGYGPVVDETHLTGKYDIDLAWAPDMDFEPKPIGGAAPPELPNAPTADLFTAVRESLGLKLERRSIPTSYFVIDHIERIPTGN